MSEGSSQAGFVLAWWVYVGVAGLVLIYGGVFVFYVWLLDRFRDRF